jgi:hypothetical protein
VSAPGWLDELRSTPVIKPKRWSELSGCARSSVYDQIANGSLPSIRLGNAIVIPTAPLLRLLGADPEGAVEVEARSRTYDDDAPYEGNTS